MRKSTLQLVMSLLWQGWVRWGECKFRLAVVDKAVGHGWVELDVNGRRIALTDKGSDVAFALYSGLKYVGCKGAFGGPR